MSPSLAFDLLSVAVAALAQALSGYMGWRVTVDGVRQERRKLYEIAFAACAVLGVLATVLTAYRGSNIGVELSGIEQTIDKMERHAQVVFVSYTSDVPEITVGKPAAFNISYGNKGNVVANNVTGFGRVYILSDIKDVTQRESISRFQSEWSKERDLLGKGRIQPGGQDQFFFTAKSDRAIKDADMSALKDGSEYLVIITALEFDDLTGQHYIHNCQWVQPPAFAPVVLDFCVGFNEQN